MVFDGARSALTGVSGRNPHTISLTFCYVILMTCEKRCRRGFLWSIHLRPNVAVPHSLSPAVGSKAPQPLFLLLLAHQTTLILVCFIENRAVPSLIGLAFRVGMDGTLSIPSETLCASYRT